MIHGLTEYPVTHNNEVVAGSLDLRVQIDKKKCKETRNVWRIFFAYPVLDVYKPGRSRVSSLQRSFDSKSKNAPLVRGLNDAFPFIAS